MRSRESGSEPFRELSVGGFVARQDRHHLLQAFPKASGGLSDDYRRSKRVGRFCVRNEQISVVKQLRRFAFALTASNHEAPRDPLREAISDIFERSNAELSIRPASLSMSLSAKLAEKSRFKIFRPLLTSNGERKSATFTTSIAVLRSSPAFRARTSPSESASSSNATIRLALLHSPVS